MKEQYERLKMEKENIEREVSMSSQDESRISGKGRDMARQVERLNEQLKSTKESYGEQIEELSAEVKQLRGEIAQMERLRGDSSQKDSEIRRLSRELEKSKADVEGMLREKQAIIEEMKKIKSGYEAELRKKEGLFEGKIRDIRALLEESLAKEKQSKEEVSEIGRKYKKVGV